MVTALGVAYVTTCLAVSQKWAKASHGPLLPFDPTKSEYKGDAETFHKRKPKWAVSSEDAVLSFRRADGGEQRSRSDS